MPVAIVAIIFGSFLLLMKMILSHRQENRVLPPVNSGSSVLLSEIEQMMEDRVKQAMEPLVARIDELESAQLLATSEKMLISESVQSSTGERAKSESHV